MHYPNNLPAVPSPSLLAENEIFYFSVAQGFLINKTHHFLSQPPFSNSTKIYRLSPFYSGRLSALTSTSHSAQNRILFFSCYSSLTHQPYKSFSPPATFVQPPPCDQTHVHTPKKNLFSVRTSSSSLGLKTGFYSGVRQVFPVNCTCLLHHLYTHSPCSLSPH